MFVRAHGRRAAVIAASLALLLSGCAGSVHHTSTAADVHSSKAADAHSSKPVSVCTPQGRDAVARFFGAQAVSIATHVGIASSGTDTCYFTVKLSRGAPVHLSVGDERTVEAYFLLERAITELSQVFAPTRLAPAPETVPHLGLDASWFPAEGYVMTTDGNDLITATVNWSAPQARRIALATVAARAYLGPLDWKAAENTY